MKEINLTVSVEEAQIIINGLAKLPLEMSIQVFQKIQKQAAEQINEPDKQEESNVL